MSAPVRLFVGYLRVPRSVLDQLTRRVPGSTLASFDEGDVNLVEGTDSVSTFFGKDDHA
jgi:hypothetical protein